MKMNSAESSTDQRPGSSYANRSGSRDSHNNNISISAVISASCVVLEGLRDGTDGPTPHGLVSFPQSEHGQQDFHFPASGYVQSRNLNNPTCTYDNMSGRYSHNGLSADPNCGNHFFESDATAFTDDGNEINMAQSGLEYRDGHFAHSNFLVNTTHPIRNFSSGTAGKELFCGATGSQQHRPDDAITDRFDHFHLGSEAMLSRNAGLGVGQEVPRGDGSEHGRGMWHSKDPINDNLIAPPQRFAFPEHYATTLGDSGDSFSEDGGHIQDTMTQWSVSPRTQYQTVPSFLDIDNSNSCSQSDRGEELAPPSNFNNLNESQEVSLYHGPNEIVSPVLLPQSSLISGESTESFKINMVPPFQSLNPDSLDPDTAGHRRIHCFPVNCQQTDVQPQASRYKSRKRAITDRSCETVCVLGGHFDDSAKHKNEQYEYSSCSKAGIASGDKFTSSQTATKFLPRKENFEPCSNCPPDGDTRVDTGGKNTNATEMEVKAASTTKGKRQRTETVEHLQHQLEMLEDSRQKIPPSCVSLNLLRQRNDLSGGKTESDEGATALLDVDHMISSGVTVAGFKPRAIIRKRSKTSTPSDLKDIDYWQKRRKNNDSARKSRESKKEKEKNFYKRALELEYENFYLQECLRLAEAKLAALGHSFVPPSFG